MALLDEHLEGAGPPLLLLAGEPGIGKTRLLDALAERAVRSGWAVLAGGGGRAGDPYAPLLDALEQHLRRTRPAARRAALQGCAWLARLLPDLRTEVSEPLPGWPLPPERERRLVFDAAGRFLANVAGPAGTLLLLDDMHRGESMRSTWWSP